MESIGDSSGSGADGLRKKKGGATTRQRLGWGDLKVLLLFLGYVLVIEGIALFIWSWSIDGTSVNDSGKTLSGFGVFAVAMICSGAASLVGGLLGFLFGIPRSVESSAGRLRLSSTTAGAGPEVGVSESATASASTPSVAPLPSTAERPQLLRVNTNLEDISDGVTKVLLGAGLAEAGKLVDGAGSLAAFLGPSFGPGSAGQAVAIATIIYGALGGFFAGYLATRLYLTAAFERHDPQKSVPA
jgi:hypothetical protein